MGGAKQFCLSDDVETTKLADKLLVVIFWSVIPQSGLFGLFLYVFSTQWQILDNLTISGRSVDV